MNSFYKILSAALVCGFFYLQYDLRSGTAGHFYSSGFYFTDSLKESDTLRVVSDSLELKKIKLAEGKELYEKKCRKCHELHAPKDYRLKAWKENLDEMKEKAELNKNEYNLILDYLSANCKK